MLLVILVSCQLNKTEKFQVNGFVEGATDRILLVKKFDGEGYQIVDSVRVRNGEFSYSGKLKYPELFRFYLDNNEDYFPVFLENKRITINTSLRNFRAARVNGSESHTLYQAFVSRVDSFNQVAAQLLKVMKGNKQLSDAEKKFFKMRLDSLAQQQIEYVKAFVLDHRRSVVSLYVLYKYLSSELPVEEFEHFYRQMNTALYSSPYAAYIEHQLDIMKHTRVGQKAYPLVLPDTTGTSVDLQLIRNRYILLHFWASWCDACRDEIPEVVHLFQQHQNQLTIVGISLDTNFKRWKEAIKLYRMNWQHLSDLKGWKNKAASIFGVRAIPYYILLDENQVILYRGSRLEEVKKMLRSGR
ncbi:MAG: DUF4369 domain-containing protein [Bacteroidales bacterium]